MHLGGGFHLINFSQSIKHICKMDMVWYLSLSDLSSSQNTVTKYYSYFPRCACRSPHMAIREHVSPCLILSIFAYFFVHSPLPPSCSTMFPFKPPTPPSFILEDRLLICPWYVQDPRFQAIPTAFNFNFIISLKNLYTSHKLGVGYLGSGGQSVATEPWRVYYLGGPQWMGRIWLGLDKIQKGQNFSSRSNCELYDERANTQRATNYWLDVYASHESRPSRA